MWHSIVYSVFDLNVQSEFGLGGPSVISAYCPEHFVFIHSKRLYHGSIKQVIGFYILMVAFWKLDTKTFSGNKGNMHKTDSSECYR